MAVRTPPSTRRIGSKPPSSFTPVPKSVDKASIKEDLDESLVEVVEITSQGPVGEETRVPLESQDDEDVSAWLDGISEIPYDKKDYQEHIFPPVTEEFREVAVVEDSNEPKQVRKWVTVLLWVLAITGFLILVLLLLYIKFVAGIEVVDGFLGSFKDWVDGILGR